MSPSDFGERLKPFVFLDSFDHKGAPLNGALHPHSGIATPTLKFISIQIGDGRSGFFTKSSSTPS
jgi:hypothetical protein